MRIRHEGLDRFARSGEARGIQAQHAAKLRILLAAVNTAKGPADLGAPGFGLHPLKGDRKGQWAVSVSGNWRLVFAFEGEHITDVDYVDYH
jgi:proteic killer suppression protein